MNKVEKGFIAKILFQRKGLLFLPESENELQDKKFVAAFSRIFFNITEEYTVGEEAIKRITKTSIEDLKLILESFSLAYKEMKGSKFDLNNCVMYKNFPESVENKSDDELLYDRLVGYCLDIISDKEGLELREMISFDGPVKTRSKLSDKIKIKVIKPATEEDFYQFVKNLIQGNNSISEDDQSIIEKSLELFGTKVLPEKITQKEILVFVVKKMMELNYDTSLLPIKNTTDAMRLAEAYKVVVTKNESKTASKTLKVIARKTTPNEKVTYKIPNKQRMLILSIIENDENRKENLWRNRTLAIRIGEICHPRKYEKRFPKAAEAFSEIRNNIKPITFNHQIEKALQQKNIEEVLGVITKRPGEFARRLDHLLVISNVEKQTMVLKEFETIAEKVNVRLLFELITHFNSRMEEQDIRFVFPKGNVSKVQIIEKNQKPLTKELCEKVITICDAALKNILSSRGDMGKVYISKEFKNIPIPFATRADSKTYKTVSRGSRFSISEETKCIRAFIYWKGDDVDLSASFLDENCNEVGHISYTNLRYKSDEENDIIGCHSGDITSARNGASEFIDINLDVLKNQKNSSAKYIAYQVYSYSGDNFSDIEECYFGIMEREKANSGEIFEEKTVKMKFDLTSASVSAIPMLYDIENKVFIWMDLTKNDTQLKINNSEAYRDITAKSSHAILNLKKPNMYDIILKNVMSRNGTLVDTPEEADLCFSFEGDVTPFDRDVFVSTLI